MTYPNLTYVRCERLLAAAAVAAASLLTALH